MTRNQPDLAPEHARALALVRAAKLRKLRAGRGDELTPGELDRLLAPPARRGPRRNYEAGGRGRRSDVRGS